MSDIVDADELLRRIRAARDWARSQEEDAPDDTAATAYRAVRRVLERLVDPSHPTAR
ncbi:hypothetical protein LUX12_01240 [Streptomyces somaliensis]|uniref:hypothetical protein n=1 Tax=Streptomyces somaliensis TaxID=78355 RepID=UPI0020CEA357|nr:hypothetical protein [Streptomyces somaliensis]MCP9943739.1 hypothetical protein [Streptomyces somaliensis]MCP9963015.1 hypothetical protein [Streptomyces somaliensis]MCP9975866.1 hypothetical protein [Streptomyces somaliensis]MCQ0025243.1 hypothetical protein [Streptomyces somaliensis DSM 40738]